MKENLMEIDRAKEPYTYITITSLEKMGKQIQLLQEQLADANKLLLSLKHHAICDFDRIIYGEYIDKWGVK